MKDSPNLRGWTDKAVQNLRRRSLLADLIVAFPATVTKYDAATREAEIEPSITQVFPGLSLDVGAEPTEQAIPPIPNVRVLFPGNGKALIDWDLVPGDHVLALACDQYLGRFFAGAEKVAPTIEARHTFANVVCIPLHFASDAEASSGPASGGTIRINGGASAVALAPLVAAQLAVLKGAFDAWTPSAGDGGLALKTILTAALGTWPATMEALGLKAT